MQQALPAEPREVEKLLRQYIINLVYTIVGDRFKEWVDAVIDARNARITTERNLGIQLDPEIMQAFAASTAVSSKFG